MAGSPWGDLDRPPLDVRALNRALVDGGLWRDVRVVDETGSTNADVAELAKSGAPEGLVLVAEYQGAGRGRLGRGWSAPPRSGLSFSVLLRPAGVPPSHWTTLPLVVGVAVARAVSELASVEVRLKWPNDLLIGERKLAGILAERVETGSGAAVVVGIGLNVTLRSEELPVPTATSLALAGASCTDCCTLLKGILRSVGDEYARWRDAATNADVLADYRKLCVTLGRDVRVELPGGEAIVGSAVAIDDAGSLVIETPFGRRVVSAGDVVHVR